MTRDEQLDVLKGLLARVQSSAQTRSGGLPKASAPVAREEQAVTAEVNAPIESDVQVHDAPLLSANARSNGGLTAFSESGSGTHAPLALVGAASADPARSQAPVALAAREIAPSALMTGDIDDDDDDSPRTAVSISFVADSPHASPQAPPLEPKPTRLPFETAFDDEVTSNGDPVEIEAAALASSAAAADQARPEAAPPARAPTPLPAVGASQSIATPVPAYVQTPPPPARLSSLPAVPLTLDDLDLDGLGTPEAAVSVPPPMPASYLPPPVVGAAARISKPPLGPGPSLAALVAEEPAPPPYLPTPVPPTPPPPTYVPTPAPPRVLIPVVQPPPLPPWLDRRAEPDEIELDEGDVIATSPPPAQPVPDANRTVRGSVSPYAGVSMDDDLDAPASQRQMRLEDRALDDQLEGISEAPPESGEVESQRYTKNADEIDQTAEVHALSAVDVVARPSAPVAAAVASFAGRLPVARRLTFGDILDSALDL